MGMQHEDIVNKILKIRSQERNELSGEVVLQALTDTVPAEIDLKEILIKNKQDNLDFFSRLKSLEKSELNKLSSEERVAILQEAITYEKLIEKAEENALEVIANYDELIDSYESSLQILAELLVKNNATFGEKEKKLQEVILQKLHQAEEVKTTYIATDRDAFLGHKREILHKYGNQLEQGKLVITPFGGCPQYR